MSELGQAVDLLQKINLNTSRILCILEKPPKITFLRIAAEASVFIGILGGFVALADFIIRLIGGRL